MTAENLQQETELELCTTCNTSYPSGTGICQVDGTELISTMRDPMVGVILPKKYRIIGLLGRGAMSVVYRGVHEPSGQTVAVKLLKSHLVSDTVSARRFQMEAQTVGALQHPNIVDVLHHGVTEQGVPYLVMELVAGDSLADMLRNENSISVNRIIRIFAQAASALAYAHDRGVIHRDMKPSNIVVCHTQDERDIVKIVDFGIAKMQGYGITSQNLTATGEVVGTPMYMSPEQTMGKDLDGRSDIYSMGCVMYECVTGTPPFVGQSAVDTMHKQILQDAVPVDIVRPDLYIPERLKNLINLAMTKDVRYRYQHMRELQADLEDVNRSTMVNAIVPEIKDTGTWQRLMQGDFKYIAAGVAAVIILGTAGGGFMMMNIGNPAGGPGKGRAPVAGTGDWQPHMTKGQELLRQGKYEEAQSMLLTASREAEAFPQPDARLGNTLNQLATAYYLQDNYADAAAASEKALEIHKKTGTPGNANIAESLSNLAMIRCAQGNFAEAEKLGKQGLSMREQALGSKHPDVANSLQALAELKVKKKNFKQAEQMLTRALEIRKRSLGAQNPEVANTLYNLGMVAQKQDNHQKAETLYKQALAIQQMQLGAQHIKVADTMTALGTLNYYRHNNKQARTLLNNALSIREKAEGRQSAKVAEILFCLAVINEDESKFGDAEQQYRECLEIREKLWGSNSPRLVNTLERMAGILRKTNQGNGAEFYDAQAKAIRKQT
jgi:tetratricopeptide (TPR) repeat protein